MYCDIILHNKFSVFRNGKFEKSHLTHITRQNICNKHDNKMNEEIVAKLTIGEKIHIYFSVNNYRQKFIFRFYDILINKSWSLWTNKLLTVYKFLLRKVEHYKINLTGEQIKAHMEVFDKSNTSYIIQKSTLQYKLLQKLSFCLKWKILLL